MQFPTSCLLIFPWTHIDHVDSVVHDVDPTLEGGDLEEGQVGQGDVVEGDPGGGRAVNGRKSLMHLQSAVVTEIHNHCRPRPVKILYISTRSLPNIASRKNGRKLSKHQLDFYF